MPASEVAYSPSLAAQYSSLNALVQDLHFELSQLRLAINETQVAALTDHGTLSGLGDDDHPQYAEIAGTETISGTWAFTGPASFGNTVTISGVTTLYNTLLTYSNINFVYGTSTLAGIQVDNLVDKTAVETITGAWTFSAAIAADGGITFDDLTDTIAGIENQNLLDKTAVETVTGNWAFSNAVTFASGLYSYGNIDMAYPTSTIAGIQNQNLVDKTATETISGAWTFTTKPTTTAGIAVTGGSVEMGGSGTVVWASTGMTIDNDEISLPDGHRGIEFHKNVGTPTPADSFWLVSSVGSFNALSWDWNPGTYGATNGLMSFGDATNNVNTSHRGNINPAVTKTYSVGADGTRWGGIWGYRGYFGTANFSASGGSTFLFGETAHSSHSIEGTAGGSAAFGATTGANNMVAKIIGSGRGSFASGNVQTYYPYYATTAASIVASGLGTRAHGWVRSAYGYYYGDAKIIASGNGAAAFGGINVSSQSDYLPIAASGAGSFVAGYVSGTGSSRSIKGQGPGAFVHATLAGGAGSYVLASGTGNFIHCSNFSVASSVKATGTGSIIIGSASAGDMTSSGNGSCVIGIATAGNMTASGAGSTIIGDAAGGNITSGTADGTFAGGRTKGSGAITASGTGAFVWSYAGGTGLVSATGTGAIALGGTYYNAISPSTGTITASGNGSFAVGYVPSTVSIVASAQNSAQFFPGTNAEIGALGVGIRGSGGMRLCSLGAPSAKNDGDMWVDYTSSNLVYIRSNGVDVPITAGGFSQLNGSLTHDSYTNNGHRTSSSTGVMRSGLIIDDRINIGIHKIIMPYAATIADFYAEIGTAGFSAGNYSYVYLYKNAGTKLHGIKSNYTTSGIVSNTTGSSTLAVGDELYVRVWHNGTPALDFVYLYRWSLKITPT